MANWFVVNKVSTQEVSIDCKKKKKMWTSMFENTCFPFTSKVKPKFSIVSKVIFTILEIVQKLYNTFSC